jgi:hypothetical protein
MKGSIRTSRRAPPAREGAEGVLAALLAPGIRDTDEGRAACAWLAAVGQALIDTAAGLRSLAKGAR